MTTEYEALEAILRRKHHSVPRTALYWLYFKWHILEKEYIRKLLQRNQSTLAKAEFREILFSDRDCNPERHGPSFCRLSHQKSRERHIGTLVSITYQYYLALFAPTSDIEVRTSTITSVSLGVFLKRILNADRDDGILSSSLFGLPLEISKDGYEELLNSSYPSILGGYRKLNCRPLNRVNIKNV